MYAIIAILRQAFFANFAIGTIARIANMRTMNDPQQEIRVWMQEQMDEQGHGVRGRLAEFLGVRPDAITRMANTDPEKETREIRGHELQRMEAFFGVPAPKPGRIFPRRSVPIMGYLGAGAEVEPDYEQVPPEGFDTVELPFPLPDDMIAFRVRGISMLPVFKDGAVVIVYREQRRAIETFYGEEAAVRTIEGKRYIKTITRGSRSGTVNLMSWNDPQPIENQRLEWIGEIFTIMPPTSIRKAERQGGVQGSLRLGYRT